MDYIKTIQFLWFLFFHKLITHYNYPISKVGFLVFLQTTFFIKKTLIYVPNF